MLVALDGSWAVLTPKKCGTHSLYAALCPSEYGRDRGHLPDLAASIGGWHEPKWGGVGKRVMVVRHPFDRLASMVWFAEEHSQPYPHKPPTSPDYWVRRLLDDRRLGREETAEWWRTCSDYADLFRPDVACRLEDGLEKVFGEIGLGGAAEVLHRNRTQQRLSTEETLALLSAETMERVSGWAAEDLNRWY